MRFHMFADVVRGKRFLMALMLIAGLSFVNSAPIRADQAVRGAATKNQALKKYFQTLNDLDGKGFVYVTCTPDLEKSLDLMMAGTSDSYIQYVQGFMNESSYAYTGIKKAKYKKISAKQKARYDKILGQMKKGSKYKLDLSGAYSVKIKYKGKASSERSWRNYKSVLILYKSEGRWFVLDVD